MKKNKVFIASIFLLILIFLLTACFQEKSTPKLSVSPQNISAKAGESTSFTIANNGEGKLKWSISTEADWLEIDKLEGSGTRQIIVEVSDNAEKNDSARIKINSNAGNKKINFVVSNSSPILSISPSTINAERGGETFFTIANNGEGKLEWEIKTDVDWLVFNKKEGTGTTQVKVNVANSAKENEEAIIEVISNGGEKEIEFIVSENKVPDVKEFDVRGITAPIGKVNPKIIKNKSLDITNLKLNVNKIQKYKVPEGYETGYIFSWEKVNNVDGYQIYVEDDNEYKLFADLSPSQLEIVNDNYVYVKVDNDDIGTVKRFKIKAYISNLEGNYSQDKAVILPETTLETPTDGDEVIVNNPLFIWNAVDDIAGYQLMISKNNEDNVFYRVNLDNNEYKYSENLNEGSYFWGVLTVGQGENANGLSLSKFNDFSIKLAN